MMLSELLGAWRIAERLAGVIDGEGLWEGNQKMLSRHVSNARASGVLLALRVHGLGP